MLLDRAPDIGLEQLLSSVHQSTLLERTFSAQAHFLQEQEDWSKREENSLGAGLEDLEDLRPDQ
jgi:hypothetical protein